MTQDLLGYNEMVERAMRSVVRQALTHAAENGLPGNHHFYVTFNTDHPDVGMPDHLRQQYPSEMTIVLQHQFWGLEIDEDGFEVTLSFNKQPERLRIPFEIAGDLRRSQRQFRTAVPCRPGRGRVRRVEAKPVASDPEIDVEEIGQLDDPLIDADMPPTRSRPTAATTSSPWIPSARNSRRRPCRTAFASVAAAV